MKLHFFVVIVLSLAAPQATLLGVIVPAELTLTVGEGTLLKSSSEASEWTSIDPAVAVVYRNGFVVALKPGQAVVRAGAGAGGDVCRVRVITGDEAVVPLSKIQQFKDNREFVVNGRKCVGSELNGKVLGEKRDNR